MTTKAETMNRPTRAARETIAPHERPRLTVRDACTRRGISYSTWWRAQRLPGFPRPDPLGRFASVEVDAFFDGLDREAFRAVRRELDAAAAAKAAQAGATDSGSVERRARAAESQPLTRRATRDAPALVAVTVSASDKQANGASAARSSTNNAPGSGEQHETPRAPRRRRKTK